MSEGQGKNRQKRKGARHRTALYDRARLELEILEVLDMPDSEQTEMPCRPISVRTLAELFDMETAAMGKVIDDFRLAGLVLYNQHTQMASLVPA